MSTTAQRERIVGDPVMERMDKRTRFASYVTSVPTYNELRMPLTGKGHIGLTSVTSPRRNGSLL
jgi:hypothetical protein